MRVMDIVTMDDTDGLTGIIETIKTFQDGMTIYAVRSPFTGDLYAREADEITLVTDEVRACVLQSMRVLNEISSLPVPELKIVKDYGNAIMTQGMVDAEVRASEALDPGDRVEILARCPQVIGINASTNMFA